MKILFNFIFLRKIYLDLYLKNKVTNDFFGWLITNDLNSFLVYINIS